MHWNNYKEDCGPLFSIDEDYENSRKHTNHNSYYTPQRSRSPK